MPQLLETHKDNFTMSTDPARLDIDAICGFLTRAYWALGRPRERTERAFANSLVFGLYDGEKQIGLARAGCRAAHVDTAGDAGFAQHHRAAGGPTGVGVVPDLQSRNVGDRTGERCHADKTTAWSSTTSARRDRRHRRAARKQRAGG